MEERISKIFGPNTLIIIQTLIILVSFSNLTEFFYHYAEEHGAFAGSAIGTFQTGYLLSGLMAVGIDAATMVFTIAALKIWEASHEWRSVIIPVILMLITSSYSAVGNYITIRAQTVGYDQVELFGVSANAIAPLMISALPYLSVIITVAIPLIFPRTKAATTEEQQQQILRIHQEAELKAARAQAGALVAGARVGSALNIAKQTGIGKRLAERISGDEEEIPDENSVNDEEQIDPAQPELVGIKTLLIIFNMGWVKDKKTNLRTMRNWVINGKTSRTYSGMPFPREKKGEQWVFDLRQLENHPDFTKGIARWRAKQLGGKAPASRPAQNWRQDSGPIGSVQEPFSTMLHQPDAIMR